MFLKNFSLSRIAVVFFSSGITFSNGGNSPSINRDENSSSPALKKTVFSF